MLALPQEVELARRQQLQVRRLLLRLKRAGIALLGELVIRLFLGGGAFGERDVLLFTVDKYELLKRLFDEINKGDNHIITLKQTGATN